MPEGDARLKSAVEAYGDVYYRVERYESEDWNRLAQAHDHDAVELLGLAHWLGLQLIRDDFVALPDDATQQAIDLFVQLMDLADVVYRFSDDDSGSASIYQTTRESIRGCVSVLIPTTAAWASVAILRRNDDPQGEAYSLMREIQELRNTAEHQVELAEEAKRRVSALVAAKEFGEEFRTAAKEDRDVARRWLYLGGSFLAIAIGVAAWLIFETPDTENWDWIPHTAGKVFILSLLTYAATWCGRTAFVNYHSSSLNRHRENSILTLPVLRDAADTDNVRDEVVLEASKAVFENLQTGYVGGKSAESPNIVNNALRVARSADET